MRNHLFKALFFLSEEMHEAGHEASSSAFICGVFASVGRPADDGRTVHLRRILVDFSSDSSIFHVKEYGQSVEVAQHPEEASAQGQEVQDISSRVAEVEVMTADHPAEEGFPEFLSLRRKALGHVSFFLIGKRAEPVRITFLIAEEGLGVFFINFAHAAGSFERLDDAAEMAHPFVERLSRLLPRRSEGRASHS